MRESVDGNLLVSLALQSAAEIEDVLKRQVLSLKLELIRANEQIAQLTQALNEREQADANQRDGDRGGEQPRSNGAGHLEAGAQDQPPGSKQQRRAAAVN